MQKVRVSGYISFSIFGLSAILAGGTLIIVLSWVLHPLAVWLRKRKGACPYALLEWTTNETLQLQRLAYEGHGLGMWSRATKSVPVTQPGEYLGVLDISNPQHPTLHRPASGDEVGVREFEHVKGK